ncbi:MAG: hypothetical protein Q6L50_08250 [Gloeomargarita sp. GMQP_bins_120]
MGRILRRPTCELRWGWGRFVLKLANGLEIQGRWEQLTALRLWVLAYLTAPSPPVSATEAGGEMVPVGYHLSLTGLAPALDLTLQELYDLAWVLEAAQTPRFPWWQQLAGWVTLGTGLVLALALALIPRPVEVQVVTPTPTPRKSLPPSALQALPSPPPPPTVALDTVLPPPVVTPEPLPPSPAPVSPLLTRPQSVTPTTPPPELQGVQRYFQQRWQPPDTLQQPLSYRLVITPTGVLSRIVPLSPEAGLFLDQTPMPLVGETFMGFLPRTAQLQVVLEPSGQVRVQFERWVD